MGSKRFDLKLVKEHYDNLTNSLCSTPHPFSIAKSPSDEEFRMILPPPNVTGNLHIGHAVTVTIEDAVCRYQKLCGKKVCICTFLLNKFSHFRSLGSLGSIMLESLHSALSRSNCSKKRENCAKKYLSLNLLSVVKNGNLSKDRNLKTCAKHINTLF